MALIKWHFRWILAFLANILVTNLITINQENFVTATGSTVINKFDCPKELLWNKKSNLGDDVGVQLQVCCNVSRVTIRKLDPKNEWQMSDDAPIRIQFGIEDVDEMWSELQLSICEKDHQVPTLGYVQSRPKNRCLHPQGKIINVNPDLFDMDNWFVICYTTVNGCHYCHMEILCQNDYSQACAAVWMQSSASIVKNDSITLWVLVGPNMPFASTSIVKVTVTDRSSENEQPVVARYSRVPRLNKTINLEVTNLRPNSFYQVQTCLEISPPGHFKRRYAVTMEKPKPICQQNVYRTFATSLQKSNSNGIIMQFNSNCVARLSLLISFCILMQF